MFIVFEGLDFARKSTLASKLRDYIILKTDKTVQIFAETYHTESGKKFLESAGKISSYESLELLYKARSECLRKADEYDIIIFDRYYYSSVVYQLPKCINEPEYQKSIKLLMQMFLRFRKPDIVFFLKYDYDNYVKRVSIRNKDIHEFDKMSKEEFDLRQSLYLASIISSVEPISNHGSIPRVFVIDTNKSIDDCFKVIKDIADEYIID